MTTYNKNGSKKSGCINKIVVKRMIICNKIVVTENNYIQ